MHTRIPDIDNRESWPSCAICHSVMRTICKWIVKRSLCCRHKNRHKKSRLGVETNFIMREIEFNPTNRCRVSINQDCK